MELKINSYVFFVPPPSPIFHPKIYFFEGQNNSELIIGSSNLTANGLFTNVEASILISIDNHNATDKKIVEGLKDYFKGFFNQSDPNLKPLTTELIDDLVNAKIVPTEAERKELQDKGEKADKEETQIILSKIFPKRAACKNIQKIFVQIRKPNSKRSRKLQRLLKPQYSVWESGPLTERDIKYYPKAQHTKPYRLNAF